MSSVDSKHDQIGILPPQDPALRSVRSVLQDGLCPAACQGVVQLSSPVAIYGRGQSGRLFDVQLPPIGEAALQSLLDAAVPAADDLRIASKEVRQQRLPVVAHPASVPVCITYTEPRHIRCC